MFLDIAGSEEEIVEPHASDRKYTDGKTPIMWIITENNMWVELILDFCHLAIIFMTYDIV